MKFRNSLVKKVLEKQFRDWEDGTIQEQRARQEKAVRLSRKLPLGIEYHPFQVNGIPAGWFNPCDCGPGAVLYLHGGAYCLGSINTHRELIGRLAESTNREVLAIEYRLAPEFPHPAALEDALNAYHWLLDQGTAANQLIIAGDSAGGGLALALLIALRDAKEELPAAAVLLSPWTDLAMEGDSAFKNTETDPILDRAHLLKKAGWYAGEYAIKHPLVSPLYADFSGLPPLLFQAGSEELLLDDSVRAAESARKAGVDATLEIYEEMVHVFQVIPFLEETKQALESISRFVEKHTEVRD